MRIDDFVDGIYALAKDNGLISLSDPYQLENNDEMSLDGGFGVIVGGATREESSFSGRDPQICMTRNIGLVSTAQNMGDREDINSIKAIESTIRNNVYQFFSKIKNDRNLSSIVLNLEVSSDELIFFGGEDEVEYLAFTLNINVTNKELI